MHWSLVTIITTTLVAALSLFAEISVTSDLRFLLYTQLNLVNFGLPSTKTFVCYIKGPCMRVNDLQVRFLSKFALAFQIGKFITFSVMVLP